MTYLQASAHPWLDAALQSHAKERRLVAGVDLAFTHDGCALVILEHHNDRVSVVDYDFRVPKPGEPLDPIAVAEVYLDRLEAQGCRVLVADIHYVEVMRRACLNRGVTLLSAPSGDARLNAFITTRHYTRARAISFPKMIADHLRKIQLAIRPGGGVSVHAPRAEGKGHADLAYALVAAVWADARLHGLIGNAETIVRTHKGAWTAP